MDQLTPSLSGLLAPFACCFRPEVFATFCSMTAAWVVCLGRRCVSRVWETTGRSASEDHSKAFRLFSQAAWNADELGRILLLGLLARLVPGSRVYLVVDDTLCHKRGSRVAFGGVFLDAVLSSKKHKCFRYGVNWVTLGLVLELPFRRDRPFCVNLLWRAYSKEVKGAPHKKKPQLAREMLGLAVRWLPGHDPCVLADGGYVGRNLLYGLGEAVHAIGPVHPRASLSRPLPPGAPANRKRGEALGLTPRGLMGDPAYEWDRLWLRLPGGKRKKLDVRVAKGLCWYPVLGQRKIQLVLVRDPAGEWRDEMLLSTDLRQTAEEVVLAYCRRWGVEVAYCESKQLLGLHDPMVWSSKAVQRAHPMAWLVGGVVVLWYAQAGIQEEQARRHRPWYKHKVSPTMADMLACCRLHLWRHWLENEPEKRQGKLDWLLEYIATAA